MLTTTLNADPIYRVRRYRSGEGAIRLEGSESEKAKHNRQRKECTLCQSFSAQCHASKAGRVLDIPKSYRHTANALGS